jgi:hypothetical protein
MLFILKYSEKKNWLEFVGTVLIVYWSNFSAVLLTMLSSSGNKSSQRIPLKQVPGKISLFRYMLSTPHSELDCVTKRVHNIIFQNSIQLTRYLEFDGTMEKIWVNRSSTQEELQKYRRCSLFNDERETTRAKFWKTCWKWKNFPFYYNC